MHWTAPCEVKFTFNNLIYVIKQTSCFVVRIPIKKSFDDTYKVWEEYMNCQPDQRPPP